MVSAAAVRLIEIGVKMVKRLTATMSTDIEIAEFLGSSARTVARAEKTEAFQWSLTLGRNLAKLDPSPPALPSGAVRQHDDADFPRQSTFRAVE